MENPAGSGKSPNQGSGTSAKKKREKAAGADPNAPKKAVSAFFHFSIEKRKALKEEAGDAKLDFAETAKKVSDAWKALGEDDKKKYEALAAKDKARYQEEMSTYVPPQNLPAAKKKKKRKKKGAKKKAPAAKRAKKAKAKKAAIESDDEEDYFSDDDDSSSDDDLNLMQESLKACIRKFIKKSDNVADITMGTLKRVLAEKFGERAYKENKLSKRRP